MSAGDDAVDKHRGGRKPPPGGGKGGSSSSMTVQGKKTRKAKNLPTNVLTFLGLRPKWPSTTTTTTTTTPTEETLSPNSTALERSGRAGPALALAPIAPIVLRG